MSEHPTPAALEALIGQALAEEERETMMEHLVECEDCFATYEEIWARVSQDLQRLSGLALDPQSAARLESRLFRRIHLASLASASGWLISEGLLRAVLGILLPLVDLGRAPAKKGKKP